MSTDPSSFQPTALPLDVHDIEVSVSSTPEISANASPDSALVPVHGSSFRALHGVSAGAEDTSGVIAALRATRDSPVMSPAPGVGASPLALNVNNASANYQAHYAHAHYSAAAAHAHAHATGQCQHCQPAPVQPPPAAGSASMAAVAAAATGAPAGPGAAERQAVKRRVLCMAATALCLLVSTVAGFIIMAVFGGICAASLSGDGPESWTCGGSGVGAAVVLLVLGLAPFALVALVMTYNAVHFCCTTKTRRDGCCGTYNEIAW